MKKSVTKNSVLDIESEKIEEMFTESFKEAVTGSNGKVVIDEVECAVEKDLAADVVTVKVTVYGMAGTTPKLQMFDKKTDKIAKGFKKIKVAGYSFKLDNCFDLNTNDYVLIYLNE